MDDTCGRAAIIENGSPLFTGGTSSGESQIRRWLLEKDLIEAIIALPTDLFYNTGIATYIWVLSMNKRAERKGKIQLIDATTMCHKLRKPLGNKKNEIGPAERKAITELYLNFEENDLCKIYPNTEFIYREYAVMQPLQRSYAINEERIEQMLLNGSLNSLYDAAKIAEVDEKEDPTDKELKKVEEYKANEPRYNKIVDALHKAVSDKVYKSPETFEPVLQKALGDLVSVKDKLFASIADGLSVMDKTAEIQRDKKGNIIYDKETKDTEIVRYDEDIDTYMKREVLPHIPDAKAFFEEDLSKKKPVIKTGAEIPFTRYFYKYQKPTDSSILRAQFEELEKSIAERVTKIFD
jgi:type I restriction enzyme M protein